MPIIAAATSTPAAMTPVMTRWDRSAPPPEPPPGPPGPEPGPFGPPGPPRIGAPRTGAAAAGPRVGRTWVVVPRP